MWGTPKANLSAGLEAYSLVSGASSLLAALEILTTIPRFVAYKGNNHMPNQYIWNIPLYPLYMFGYIYHVYSINIMFDLMA